VVLAVAFLIYSHFASDVQVRSKADCNEEWCNGEQERTPINFTRTGKVPSSYSTLYYSNLKMVRLGTDLEFDPSQSCPADSYMLNKKRNSTSKHTNCPTRFIVGARKGGTTSLYMYMLPAILILGGAATSGCWGQGGRNIKKLDSNLLTGSLHKAGALGVVYIS